MAEEFVNFLVEALNTEKYKDLLFWHQKEKGVFRIKWMNIKNSTSTWEDFEVFKDWDKHKDAYQPEPTREYYIQAKRRIWCALYNNRGISELKCPEQNYKEYQIISAEGRTVVWKKETTMAEEFVHFLVEALNTEKYKDRLFWHEKDNGVFWIININDSVFFRDDFEIFQDWDTHYGIYRPKFTHDYYIQARKRFWNAMDNNQDIKDSNCPEKNYKEYQIISLGGKNGNEDEK